MTKEIIIAVIAGIAGVIGGIIAWVQAVRTTRLKAEADSSLEKMKSEALIGLEKMKAENERRRKAFEVASNESKSIEAALAQAWQDIQTLKDLISKILAPARYDLDLILNEFKPTHSNLIEGYAKWGSDLQDGARNAWHKAKGSAHNISLILGSHQAAKGSDLILSTEMTEALREIRQSLTDQQMVLAASRQTMREQLIRELLEVL